MNTKVLTVVEIQTLSRLHRRRIAGVYVDMQEYTWICKWCGLGNVFTDLLITLSIIMAISV